MVDVKGFGILEIWVFGAGEYMAGGGVLFSFYLLGYGVVAYFSLFLIDD